MVEQNNFSNFEFVYSTSEQQQNNNEFENQNSYFLGDANQFIYCQDDVNYNNPQSIAVSYIGPCSDVVSVESTWPPDQNAIILPNISNSLPESSGSTTISESVRTPASQEAEITTSSDIVCNSKSKKSRTKKVLKSASKLQLNLSSSKRKKKKKSNYKHVPHSQKPPHLVAKRNARERKRVHAVNLAFANLRKAIPFENKRGKRVSKVKVLQKAINYIQNLHNMINEVDGIPTVNYSNENYNTCRTDDSHLFDF